MAVVHGQLQPLPKPADAQLSFWYDQALLQLRSDWSVQGRTWPGGALLASDAAGGFITGSEIVVDGGYHAMTI